MTAAPAMMMASIVTELITPITLVNQAVVTLGLNAIRTRRLTVDSGTASVLATNEAISVVMICWASPEPRPAWIIAVASTSICSPGACPASTSRWKFGGISTTKVNFPAFMSGTMSASEICMGAWNSGARNAWAMRRDSTDWSSSTKAIEALCSSCELLWADMVMANEKA